MANEQRLIDAMKLVTKLAKKARFGRIEYDDVLAVIADAPHRGCRGVAPPTKTDVERLQSV